MPKITLQQAIAYASQAGFSGDSLVTMVAIAEAESGLDTTARNPSSATGIVQILLSAHPDVSYQQAIDPAFSFQYAWRLSGGGKSFCPWQSYDPICGVGYNSSYRAFLPIVKLAYQGGPASASGPSVAATKATIAAMQAATVMGNAWSLASNANVSAFLQEWDKFMSVPNPFDIDISTMQDNIAGVGFTDPIQWLSAVGNNIIIDMVGVTLRVLFVILGVYILFRVINHFIDITGTISSVTSSITKLLPLIVGA